MLIIACQVATFVDESLSSVSMKMEHSAQQFAELQSEKIASLHVCWLFTCARMENGSLYWWCVAIINLLVWPSLIITSFNSGNWAHRTEKQTCTLLYVYPTGDSVPTQRIPGTLANHRQSPSGECVFKQMSP